MDQNEQTIGILSWPWVDGIISTHAYTSVCAKSQPTAEVDIDSLKLSALGSCSRGGGSLVVPTQALL